MCVLCAHPLSLFLFVFSQADLSPLHPLRQSIVPLSHWHWWFLPSMPEHLFYWLVLVVFFVHFSNTRIIRKNLQSLFTRDLQFTHSDQSYCKARRAVWCCRSVDNNVHCIHGLFGGIVARITIINTNYRPTRVCWSVTRSLASYTWNLSTLVHNALTKVISHSTLHIKSSLPSFCYAISPGSHKHFVLWMAFICLRSINSIWQISTRSICQRQNQ